MNVRCFVCVWCVCGVSIAEWMMSEREVRSAGRLVPKERRIGGRVSGRCVSHVVAARSLPLPIVPHAHRCCMHIRTRMCTSPLLSCSSFSGPTSQDSKEMTAVIVADRRDECTRRGGQQCNESRWNESSRIEPLGEVQQDRLEHHSQIIMTARRPTVPQPLSPSPSSPITPRAPPTHSIDSQRSTRIR